ncbi:DUF998 domain-containing protein [Agromyces bauzanensis]
MSASTLAAPAAEATETRPQRRIAVETEALIAGGAAAVVSGIVAAIIFAGGLWPLWGGLSVGIVAAAAVVVTGIALGATGYWRARNLPGQEWRHRLRPWKFTIDVATVSAVHAIIAGILTITTFVLLQRSFEGLVVDVWIGLGAAAAAAGLLGYWIYLSVSSITTNKLATLLVVFMATSTLASMATSQDPQWWEYHFSQLGTSGDFSSSLFNLTLIISGAFVTTFAIYVDRDLTTLVRQGVLAHSWAPRAVSIVFIVMGVMLACVGLFPLNVSILLHNSSAIGMSLSFLGLLIASPWVLRGMPRRFFVFCGLSVVALLGGAVLFEPVAYWNLTAFELLAFALILGWIAVFIRFVDALAATGAAESDDGGYSV